jgi:hypothetical protein
MVPTLLTDSNPTGVTTVTVVDWFVDPVLTVLTVVVVFATPDVVVLATTVLLVEVFTTGVTVVVPRVVLVLFPAEVVT